MKTIKETSAALILISGAIILFLTISQIINNDGSVEKWLLNFLLFGAAVIILIDFLKSGTDTSFTTGWFILSVGIVFLRCMYFIFYQEIAVTPFEFWHAIFVTFFTLVYVILSPQYFRYYNFPG